MKCGHLFNGIGGFALAAHWMGWENLMHCEIDPFCNRVMNYHFPKSKQYEDIRNTDFSIYRGQVDIITGGDPCQPNSVAGLRGGASDSRYLWPQYRRCYNEVEARIIVNENVAGSISNGVLDQKIVDLENDGYTCWPPFVLPAGAIGALHRRDRVWLVAHSNSKRFQKCNVAAIAEDEEKRNVWDNTERIIEYGPIAGLRSVRELLRAANGISEQLAPGKRNAGIKALGNAIVPQVAFQIFQAIQQYESKIILP